jgi:hypothetical protein
MLDPHMIDPKTDKPMNDAWPHEIFEFTLNNNYLILQSKFKLWQIEIEKLRQLDFHNVFNMKDAFPLPFLDLQECCAEDDSYIADVYGGSANDGSRILIVIRRDEEEGQNTIVSWDLRKNAEIN